MRSILFLFFCAWVGGLEVGTRIPHRSDAAAYGAQGERMAHPCRDDEGSR